MPSRSPRWSATNDISSAHRFRPVRGGAAVHRSHRLPAAGELQGGDAPDVHTVADPYRFLPTLGELDLHLFSEGRHERLWDIIGAHPRSFRTADGVVEGVSFAVWAPNAKGVSLIGEFNHWDGDEAPLRVLGSTGVWELFWPGFPMGATTSSACMEPTARSPTAPTRWHSPPRSRRRSMTSGHWTISAACCNSCAIAIDSSDATPAARPPESGRQRKIDPDIANVRSAAGHHHAASGAASGSRLARDRRSRSSHRSRRPTGGSTADRSRASASTAPIAGSVVRTWDPGPPTLPR